MGIAFRAGPRRAPWASREAEIILMGPATSKHPQTAILPMANRPQWQLPRGVTRGTWEYLQTDHIADGYDDYFALNRLFEFDEQVLERYFYQPGLIIDLGAGTGRALVGLARRGFPGLAVDLSRPMLRIVAEKARLDHLPIQVLQANLVELDCIRSRSFDYAICLFSTLGMIHGRENRHRLLSHVGRILKPGGLFVLHVHNLWFNLYDSAGRRWLLKHLPAVLFDRRVELGDKYFHYRDVPRMFLHTFTRGELLRALGRAGLGVEELIPLDASRQRPLARGWFFGSFRANGWIAVCRPATE